MRLSIQISKSGRDGATLKGFTLPEILVALTIFTLLVAGIVSANLFGLRMFQVNQTKLSATEWSRNTFGKITEDVRSCDQIAVGNMDTNSNFTGLLDGEPQEGTAIQIQPSTNALSFIYYFLNAPDETFRQTVMDPLNGTNTVILADSVTNLTIFSAQDFSGTTLTNLDNNRVIHLLLEFYQPDRFLLGPDYYRLETSMTRRALN